MKETISKSARECSQGTRMIVRHPRFFLIAVLVLSLGIRMSTALFSIMYAALLKPLPVQEQDRVVVAWKGDSKDVAHIGELSYPEFQDWQRQSKAFAMMAAMPATMYGHGITLTGHGEPVELERTPVSPAFFSLLGAPAAMGRTFEESDDRPGAEPTVVLQSSAWKKQFHADPSVIGKTVDLNGPGYTVIGGMPADFDFPAGAQVWTPHGLNAKWADRPRWEIAAMHKTVAVSKIRKMEQLVGDARTGPRFTMLLFSLFGVLAGILAAVSVYGLAQRRREMGIRMALGARRKSVILMMRGETRAVLLGGIFGLPLMLGLALAYRRLHYGLPGFDFCR